MEDDRALVDIGIAAELEEAQIAQITVKQPKRRFIGRRAAAEAAEKSSTGAGSSTIEETGTIQGIASPFSFLSSKLTCPQ